MAMAPGIFCIPMYTIKFKPGAKHFFTDMEVALGRAQIPWNSTIVPSAILWQRITTRYCPPPVLQRAVWKEPAIGTRKTGNVQLVGKNPFDIGGTIITLGTADTAYAVDGAEPAIAAAVAVIHTPTAILLNFI